MAIDQWKFSDPQNVAGIADKKIVRSGDWIAFVTHDMDDGGWQFHTSGTEPLSPSDAVIVSLHEIVCLDPTVNALSDLPLGWHAWRESKEAEWERAQS